MPWQRRQVNYLLGDVIIALVSIHLANKVRFGWDAAHTDLLAVLTRSTGSSLFFVSSLLTALYLADAYNGSIDFRSRYEAVRTWSAVACALAFELLVFTVFPHGFWGRGVAGLSSLFAGIFLTAWRPFVCSISPGASFRMKTLVVGAGQAGHLVAGVLTRLQDVDGTYQLVGLVNHPRTANRRASD